MISRNVRSGFLVLWALLGFFLLSPVSAFSGNEAYFTTYSHRVEKGERELMFMNDFTVPSRANRKDGQNNYFSQMIELEYGVTNKYATELMLESFVDVGGRTRFTGFRWENRYSLSPENKWISPVLYVEYEHLKAATRYKMEVSGWVKAPYEEEEGPELDERILESRLILSRDFANTNVSFNWINETDLRSGRTDFGYSFGLMHRMNRGHHHRGNGSDRPRLAGLGFELIGGLGDNRRLALRPRDQQHYLQPLLMVHLSRRWMLHTGIGLGLTPSSDRMLVRTALGFEF